MKAISAKVPASLRIAKIAHEMAMCLSHHRIELGITGAAAAYIGCIISADLMMYAGAVLALLSVKPIEKKGGRK
ncbi:MAG: hypothetical protein HDS28_03865 [Bacteroides sp.]|nr:hypothetical protein [Bacteroides sp.]